MTLNDYAAEACGACERLPDDLPCFDHYTGGSDDE